MGLKESKTSKVSYYFKCNLCQRIHFHDDIRQADKTLPNPKVPSKTFSLLYHWGYCPHCDRGGTHKRISLAEAGVKRLSGEIIPTIDREGACKRVGKLHVLSFMGAYFGTDMHKDTNRERLLIIQQSFREWRKSSI
jgi:hypothetical protein